MGEFEQQNKSEIKKSPGTADLAVRWGEFALYFSYTFLVLTTKSAAAPSSSSSRNIVCNQAMGLNFLATCLPHADDKVV